MSFVTADGYSTVSPYLIVEGADATIAFLVRVLGATELRRMSHEDGTVRHAEVRIGDSVIMLADPVPPDWPAVPSHVHVYVPDVDTTYHAALRAGATSVQEPSQRDGEGDRRAGVTDAGGTTWWIATRVSAA